MVAAQRRYRASRLRRGRTEVPTAPGGVRPAPVRQNDRVTDPRSVRGSAGSR